jgi:hypothetical protein
VREVSELPLFAAAKMTEKPQTVEECRARGGCINIYAEDMATIIRTETCRVWCPLTGRVIK